MFQNTYDAKNGVEIVGDVLLRPAVFSFRRRGRCPHTPPSLRTPVPAPVAPSGSCEPSGGQRQGAAGAGKKRNRRDDAERRERLGQQRRREKRRSHRLTDSECGGLQPDRSRRTRRRLVCFLGRLCRFNAVLCGSAATNSSGSRLTKGFFTFGTLQNSYLSNMDLFFE